MYKVNVLFYEYCVVRKWNLVLFYSEMEMGNCLILVLLNSSGKNTVFEIFIFCCTQMC